MRRGGATHLTSLGIFELAKGFEPSTLALARLKSGVPNPRPGQGRDCHGEGAQHPDAVRSDIRLPKTVSKTVSDAIFETVCFKEALERIGAP